MKGLVGRGVCFECLVNEISQSTLHNVNADSI